MIPIYKDSQMSMDGIIGYLDTSSGRPVVRFVNDNGFLKEQVFSIFGNVMGSVVEYKDADKLLIKSFEIRGWTVT